MLKYINDARSHERKKLNKNCRFCVICYLYNKQLHNILCSAVINERRNQVLNSLKYPVCKVHVFSCRDDYGLSAQFYQLTVWR